MDHLINSTQDVKTLSQKGIIVVKLWGREHVAALLNNIGREALTLAKSNYLADVTKRINHCCVCFLYVLLVLNEVEFNEVVCL